MIETITVVVCIGLGIAIGMYISSQLERKIGLKTFNEDWTYEKNEELLDRLKHFDDAYNNGNFTYNYTHKKRKEDDN